MLDCARLSTPRSVRPPLAAGLPDETLEEVNRLWTIARAFANTAHEVNNALQVIAGNAEMLRAQDLEPAIQRRLEAISAQTGRATSLISTLQAYARADRDPSPTVDLGAIVDSAVGLRAAALRRERISVSVDAASRRAAPVAGPGARLLQIVIDVLLQAELVLKGRPAPAITVRVEPLDGSSVVRVNASASDLMVNDVVSTEEAAGALTAGAQLWAARYLAERVGGSVTAAVAPGSCEWTLAVPAMPT